MAKKAARKPTKKVTKPMMASKPTPVMKKEENYLPLLLIILAAALFFLWLVMNSQVAPTQTPALLLKPIPTSTVKTKVTPTTKVAPKPANNY